MPWADVVYGCEPRWWSLHGDCNGFAGELWSTHHEGSTNNKDEFEHLGLNLVKGEQGQTFSTNPGLIHYGSNSGFQAINLAILFGSTYIVLVGYDMAYRDKAHFFGDHPAGLTQNKKYENFIRDYTQASKNMPDVTLINATPDSKLTCFPMMSLEDAIENHRLHRDRAQPAA